MSDLSPSKDGRGAKRHQLEVYDISVDPSCAKDLAAERVDLAARYHKSILAWLAAEDLVQRASRPDSDAAARTNLAALGYGADDEAKSSTLYDTSCSCVECLKFK